METKLARFMAKFYELRTKGKPWLMAVIIGALLLFTFGLYYQAPIGKHLYWYLITPILLSLTGRILYIGIGSLIAAGLGLILVFHSGEFASAGYWQFFLIHVFVTVAMVMDGALLKKKAQEVEETANVIQGQGDLKNQLQKAEKDAVGYQGMLLILVHDLCTPVSVLTHVERFFKKTEGKNLDSEDLHGVRHKITLCSEIISDIISGARQFEALHAGKTVVHLRPFCLDPVINNLLMLYETTLSEKGVDIECDVEEGLYIHGDQRCFQNQVLSNILSNAIKFSYQGGTSFLPRTGMATVLG